MTMRRAATAAAIWAAAILAGCGGSGNGSPVGTGAFVSATIGAEGGTLVLEGASLTLPAGALAEAATVRLTETDEDPPDGFRTYSPVYLLAPAAQALAAPATLAIPFEDAPKQPTLILAGPGGTGWTDVGGTAADGVLTASVPRFGRAFVADRTNLPAGKVQ